jgi:transposase-like protein
MQAVKTQGLTKSEHSELTRSGVQPTGNGLLAPYHRHHRRVKSRVGPMLGFKRFANATIVMTGIELPQKLRKSQFTVHRLVKRARWDIHDLWMATLVA